MITLIKFANKIFRKCFNASNKVFNPNYHNNKKAQTGVGGAFIRKKVI